VSLYWYWPICWTLRALVKDSEGRIVEVQPDTQIVELIVACVTAGFSAPGVQAGSGSPGRRSAEEAPFDGGSTPVALAANEAPALAPVSSSPSWADATGEAVALAAGAPADTGTVPLAVEPDAHPAKRRMMTTAPARAGFVADAPERILGSNPRQNLLPIGIAVPFPNLAVMRRRSPGT
jgi:hypothetical protein